MKQIAFALSAGGIILLVIIGLFTIEGKSSVKRDLRSAVRESAYEALGEAVSSGYDDRQLSLLFRKTLIAKLSHVDDTGEDISIDIKSIDADKGILSVNVKRSFTYPNGSSGSADTDCTVILEEETTRAVYEIRYLIPWQAAADMGLPYKYGCDSVAAEYIVEEGRTVPVPDCFEKMTFKYGDVIYSVSELSKIKAKGDMELYVQQG